MRLRACTLTLILASCGSEESFEPQLGSRERLLDTSAAAQLDADNETIQTVTVVGDLDGDGIDDAVIRTTYAYYYPNDLEELDGNVYVLYGGQGVTGKRALHDLPRLIGAWMDEASPSVAPVGDVDGDGLADMLVSGARSLLCAGNINGEGDGLRTGAYLVYGNRTRIAGAVQIGSVSTFFRDTLPCTLVTGVTGLGDLDGDGAPDFAVARTGLHPGEPSEVMAFYGRAARWPAVTDLVAAADARIGGWPTPENGGFIPGIARVGDVDGDGYADFLIRDATPSAHDLRLVRGSATRLAGSVAAAALSQTTFAAGDQCLAWGAPATALGDLDGDGADDFAVVDCHGDGRAQSLTFDHRVFYGRKAGWAAQVSFADADATVPLDSNGYAASASGIAAGDVDGDGIPDLVVGDRHLRDDNGGVHVLPGDGTRLAGQVDTGRGLTYVSKPRRAKNCDFAPTGCIVHEQAGVDVSLGDLTGGHRLDIVIQAAASGGIVPRDVSNSSQDRVYLLSPSGTNR